VFILRSKGLLLLDLYIDADGCPVKQEVYRVAKRYGLRVLLAANKWMHIPDYDWVELVVVEEEFDAADDWIAEHITENDIVVTADIPLAARCLEKQARAINPRGRVFREDSIGAALAEREMASHLRDMGIMTGGPAPLTKRDRSEFLQRLDAVIQAVRRLK
jgi:uncharacterized protein YaiI (UPF0178 family)